MRQDGHEVRPEWIVDAHRDDGKRFIVRRFNVGFAKLAPVLVRLDVF